VFTRRKRLSREAFPTVLRGGRRVSSAHFTLVASREADGYAVVVSKKAARLSVTRHKLKRRALAALRTLPLPRSLIVMPKSSAAELSYAETQEELGGLLLKLPSAP